METTIFLLVLGLITLDIGLNVFLSVLNYRNRNTKLPEAVSHIYNNEKYVDWKDYYMENFRLNLVSSILKYLVLLVVLTTNLFVVFNNLASSITENIAFQAVYTIGFYYLIIFLINIVFSYYGNFHIEAKYGFNKMTKKTFMVDKIKSLIFIVLLGGGTIYGIVSLYLGAGDWFFILGWGIATVMMIFINLTYTKLIVPLFNKLKPLEDSSLKTKIYAFAESVGYEITKISVIDASKRSTKLNAYFSGFGKAKRIVLYDTLIEKMSEEEIVAVLAHEIGHNKHKHIIFNLITSFFMLSIYVLGLMLFLGLDVMSKAFGFVEINYGFNIVAFALILSPVLLILGLPLNYMSRVFEYQADRYASENYSPDEIQKALKVLTRENFSNLTPHPLYVKFYYSHPPLVERLNAIELLKKDKS